MAEAGGGGGSPGFLNKGGGISLLQKSLLWRGGTDQSGFEAWIHPETKFLGHHEYTWSHRLTCDQTLVDIDHVEVAPGEFLGVELLELDGEGDGAEVEQ